MERNRAHTRPARADGGRPTPGVPESTAEPDESGTEDETRTHSGRRMPGVPASTGEEEPEDRGGESCGTDAGDTTPEHDLTTAITLEALRRVRSPAAVIDDAMTWSDWVGVVGEASGPELNAFFRAHDTDVDFFNDVSDGPAERLAKIDEDHHFYSERRVLVGLPGEADWAEEAGWEFQPFATTAENAGWDRVED